MSKGSNLFSYLPTSLVSSIERTKAQMLDSYRSIGTFANHRVGFGTNVFTMDWDILLILDTCRVDVLQELKDEYDFIKEVNKIISVGGSSPEWMVNTFSEDHSDLLDSTGYISSNVYSTPVLEGDKSVLDTTERKLNRVHKWGEGTSITHHNLEYYEQLSPYQIEVDGERICPPRNVTDRGITTHRERNPDRLILHYMPPHRPYIASAKREERPLHEHERHPWRHIQETGDWKSVFDTYLDMARWVLDDVELLLDNVDADSVVITADHGEAFGEHMVYGHHTGSLHPKVRQVPWVETSATDSGSYTPEFEPSKEVSQTTEETLEALGYL